MDTLRALREEVAGKLVAAGLPATLDPAAGVPLVLVDIPRPLEPAGIGAWGVALDVKLIAAPPLDLNGSHWMTDTMVTVLATLGFAVGNPRTISHAGKDCPAMVLTYPRQATNPNC